MNLTKKLSLLGATFLTAASFSVAPAYAQDDTTAAEEEESIVVTGSRLRRDPVNAPTPLIQVQREAIINSGEANIVDYLADIPALQSSIVPEDTTGSGLGDGGLSLLNLRNLGTIRTLVLVDGRRHVGAGQGSPQVDVDTIPRLLIDNVEITTGGASAIYGADAIGGVVNFITRQDFEGIEADAVYAQINQDGQYNQRYSVLWGQNGVNDRLNVYATVEYEHSQEVLDRDIDWQQEDCTMLNRDTDPLNGPAAWQTNNDNVLDNIALCGLRSYSRPFGSVFTISHRTQGSRPADPDIPFTTGLNIIDAPYSYQFMPDGTPYLIDYGSYRDENGTQRTISVGGSGDPLWRFGDSRLPEAEAFRFQTGVHFDILENLQVFGELKAVHESTLDNFQPAFFDITLQGGYTGQPSLAALNVFTIGLDNAYLDPALQAAVMANTYQRYGVPGYTCAQQNATFTAPLPAEVNNINPDLPGQPCGALVADATARRAFVQMFADDLGSRPQDNSRDVWRAVVGLRGDLNQVAFLNNFQWEVGYTRGETNDENIETKTIDAQRFAFSVDAVVDTLGLVNGNAGEIVCRVQLLDAQGFGIVDQANGGFIDPTDARITECEPSRLFGAGGLAQAYDYITTTQRTENNDRQQDFLAFFSGDLWDLWGAGPIGLAGGYEWREEVFSGAFYGDPNRLLFANVLADFPERSFDVHEYFGEVNVPILSGVPFAESVEFNAAYRVSEYSTGVQTDTWSTTGTWRISQDVLVTGTYGFSVRAPSLGELYSPEGQTFLALADNCSAPVILNTVDPRIRDNRIANCETLWPGIITGSYVDPFPNSTNAGRSGGNPDVLDEESTSWTASIAFTPRFIPNFGLRFDYYDIEIENVVATLTLQGLMNNCVDGDAPNLEFCNRITRDTGNDDGDIDPGESFEVIDFVQQPQNFANFRAKGLDITARYSFDLEDVIGRNWGGLDYSLRGSYQYLRENVTNPVDPADITELDSTIGNPHLRLLSSLTWSTDQLALTWEVDWQSAQEIVDSDTLATDPDSRESSLSDTEDYWQHDFQARFNLNDNVSLRAGVINAFDQDPNTQTIGAGIGDNFDLFGRRYYVGVTFRH